MLVDSHCHISDARFDEDRAEVLARAASARVGKILAIASDRGDAERIRALLDAHEAELHPPPKGAAPGLPRLWGTAGIHPHEAESARDGDLDSIRALASTHPRIVAVGETGLDFFYDHSPRTLQESLFREHLELAGQLDLPIVVHSRLADDLTGRILEEWGERVRGVLHCFTGGEELLETALRVGWMVSFTGIITFKRYEGAALVRSVPRDRIMVETDAPYLAPIPHRGRRNEPAFVAKVAEGLAVLRGEDLEDVEGYTSENAVSFFGLNP